MKWGHHYKCQKNIGKKRQKGNTNEERKKHNRKRNTNEERKKHKRKRNTKERQLQRQITNENIL